MLIFATLLSGAQTKGKQTRLAACPLLSRAEVDKVTGQKSCVDAESFNGGAGCGYDYGQLLIFSGANAEAQWETTMKSFGQENVPRTPIPGLGEKACSIYPPPKNEHQDTAAFVVVKQGNRVIAVPVNAPRGKTAQSVQPQALELTKLVLSRLK